MRRLFLILWLVFGLTACAGSGDGTGDGTGGLDIGLPPPGR